MPSPVGKDKLNDNHSANKQWIPQYNPIQLAAISNFKLAQLTFAPPDLHSLRKTAVIKNMLEYVYSNTPSDWLQQMTRWQFFTPESLEEMTQEGLEEIFAQYAQTIETFRPVKQQPDYYPPTSFYHSTMGDVNGQEEDDEENDDDGQGDELWIAEDEQASINAEEEKRKTTRSSGSSCSSIFSQPNAAISAESFEARGSSPLIDKPLPASPDEKQARRKSGFNGNKNRLSWTSDTGITSSVVSQNLANEIMSLFDMDFAVDIKIDTAPKLPELPFKPKQQKRRSSYDMLNSLLPAFEKIAFENSNEKANLDETLSNNERQPQEQRQPLVIQSVPKRSSSLRHRQEHDMIKRQPIKESSSLPPPPQPPAHQEFPEKGLARKTSLLKLASFVTGNKKGQPEFVMMHQNKSDPTANRRVESTSTLDSWSSEERISIRDKPLPEPPVENTNTKKYLKAHSTKKKRKSAVVMEKTMSKHKAFQSIYDEDNNSSLPPKGLNRSKSAFIKLGGNKKQVRRVSSAKNLTTYKDDHGFVKRMASLMKRTTKPVEA
ncbi:uncharacterized protein RHIMIDRAFT_233052 [Rhizopus microsporus ATCC 52813]|uniref:Uncharacterized protein n=1 Tax=Rhizopus microsporus ATCC 52813 TaxID=1340429 RepID=A0A2G4T9F1_RHIZD|nr:uncharacterized protein RHIMIDRAFT_233052 [Rhizopus microsporus ATCC 52813]PHZ17628.1 hypothetical protein RHIMIDRAFT_233052 [Rhizopus microsporus ATCC 52813]